VEQTVPCDYWLRKLLRTLEQGLLQALLHATVAALQEEIPGLGEIVASARQAHLRLGARKQPA
jgi:hypothetical protein